MKLLAIDCGCSALSAALLEDGLLLAERGSQDGLAHSLGLLPLVNELLEQHSLRLAEMDAFAVTIGPGSFTGLRIGCATVQGWACALDKPVLAVSSTLAMAASVDSRGYVCPIFDARRNEVYTALFNNNQQLWPDEATSLPSLAERLQQLEAPITLAGDALPHYRQLFEQELGENFRVYPGLYMAGAAAKLAWQQYQAGQVLQPQQLLPRYLRLSEAEEKRLAREAEHE